MMPKLSIEVEGKTVEEAIKKALKTLKLPRNKVKIEVLSEEEKGLFGMAGAKPAKVRVTSAEETESS
jgi:spoIIIJ-associated protein